MQVQIIQSSPHLQVEDANSIRSHKVEMSGKPMIVSILRKFPKTEPLQVERHDSMLGITDAALLFELVRVSQWPIVSGEIQDGRDLPIDVLGLVKQRRRLEAGHDLISQLPDPISLSRFNDAGFLELWSCLDPLFRPAMKDHFVQQVTA